MEQQDKLSNEQLKEVVTKLVEAIDRKRNYHKKEAQRKSLDNDFVASASHRGQAKAIGFVLEKLKNLLTND